MKKKIVITGSEGLIGSKLMDHFAKTYDVVGLDIKLGHDLCDEKFVKHFFETVGDLYAVILCHAYNPIPVEKSTKVEPIDVSLDEISEYMQVNVTSAFDVCRNFIRNNDSGRIVNVSSMYGVVSPKHTIYKNFTKHIGYSLSKSSVCMLSKYLASYYAESFQINTVILGGVYEDGLDKTFISNYESNVPYKRMMNIEEVPSVFNFLLDKNNTYTTGTEIIVDGGWTSW